MTNQAGSEHEGDTGEPVAPGPSSDKGDSPADGQAGALSPDELGAPWLRDLLGHTRELKRVSKTLIETEIPEAPPQSEPVDRTPAPRETSPKEFKVAKTLLETNVRRLLSADSLFDDNESLDDEPSDSPAKRTRRMTVQRPLQELDISGLHEKVLEASGKHASVASQENKGEATQEVAPRDYKTSPEKNPAPGAAPEPSVPIDIKNAEDERLKTVTSNIRRNTRTLLKSKPASRSLSGTGIAEEAGGSCDSFVAKTLIDKELLYAELASSMQRMEVVAEKERLDRAQEPVEQVEPIESYKESAPCPWKWEQDFEFTKQRVTHCQKCMIPVYDFTDAGMEEAKSIIFQRESKKKFTLYKRADGKFTTVNCKDALRRKRNRLATLALAATAVVLALALFALFVPSHQASEEPTIADEPDADIERKQEEPATTTAAPAETPDGSFHWEAGQPINPAPQPVESSPPVNQPQYAPQSPYSDESGSFWEYSN